LKVPLLKVVNARDVIALSSPEGSCRWRACIQCYLDNRPLPAVILV